MALVLECVSKSFNDLDVLDNFSKVFEDNRVYALMGSSGKGKTTLLNLIMGLIKPDAGYIHAEDNIRFSTVFQEDRLCEGMDALGNVGLVLEKGFTKKDIIKELNAVGIKEAEGKPVVEFSGGMRRRVAIVRALMAKSDVLILDEPFKGLDVDLKEEVIVYIKERLNKRIMLMVTHDIDEAEVFNAEVIYL